MPSHKRSATVADVYDILIIGGGPAGYVAAIVVSLFISIPSACSNHHP